MGALDRFERRVESLVEGAFAKAFPSRTQPVELVRALQRAMDDHAAVVGPGRTLAPHRYVAELAPADAERLGALAQRLAGELATALAQHAGERGYALPGDVEVELAVGPDLPLGRHRARPLDAVPAAAEEAALAPGNPVRATAPAAAPASPVAAPALGVVEERSGAQHAVRGPLVVGRAADAGLRLDEPGVSRRHAELRPGDSGLEVVDLGSTNGTFVNGARVARQALRDGDRVEVGGIALLVRAVAT